VVDKPGKDYSLSSVKNALRLLNCFTLETPERRVSDLAAELGLGKSTVSRLLSTLASEGYVIKEPENKRFRLGLQILKLHSVVSSQLEINRAARFLLKAMVRDTGEAANIAVLEDDEAVYIEQIDSAQSARILASIGDRNPAYCTSSAKYCSLFMKHGH
jgi:IclR family KDG regulon transcriptional repressor